MFSDNRKISDRQLQSLLLADWMGKIVLLQPGLTRGYQGSTVILGVIAGLAVAAAVLFFIMRSAWSVPVDYYSYAGKHGGKLTAVVLYLLYGIYFLEQTTLLLFLCGEIGEIYLLPEIGKPVLMLLPAVVGYFLARGGLEIRGRVSELIGWLMAAIFLLMLVLAAFQIQPLQLQAALPVESQGFWESFYYTAAGFGSMLAIPLVFPGVEQKRGWKKKQYLVFGTAGIFLLLSYVAGYGIFGREGMNRLSWPVITLMTSVNGPGMFLQRWDILLTALLLTSLFLSVGSGIYYMEKVTMTLLRKPEKAKQSRNRVRIGCLAAAYLLALGIQDWDHALFFYRRISLWFCVPILAVLVLTIKHRKRGKRAVGAAALFLVSTLLMTGCTARELENRRFPLVLEIDVRDDQLIFGCAWPTVKEDGGKLTQNSSVNGQKEQVAELESEAEKEQSGEKNNGKQLMNSEEITRVSGKTLQEAIDNVQSLQDKYVDYSQVKAIIWGKDLVKNEQLQNQVLEWLENNPSFARNILIFQGKTQDLSLETIQEHAQGQPGAYLENLYKNNERFQEYTQRLYEFLYIRD